VPLQYKHLRGRADFQPLLATLLAKTRTLLPTKVGAWPAMESIVMQLDAIRRWTDHGRDPLPDERASITIGVLVVRELEPAPDAAMAEYNEQLLELSDYFKRWLTDAELSSFDEDDLLGDFYD
jgi:hypothetical protein